MSYHLHIVNPTFKAHHKLFDLIPLRLLWFLLFQYGMKINPQTLETSGLFMILTAA